MPDWPTGTVTFLFTDIEGSTKRWDTMPAAMQAALRQHDNILRQAIEDNGGYVFKTVGDAFYAVFPTALNSFAAALSAQSAFHSKQWDDLLPLRVRMALHTGSAEQRDGDYFGPPLNRVARILSSTHGGQVLLSQATYELLRDSLPQGVSLVDLGEYWLKGLSRPEHVFELVNSSQPTIPPCPYRGLFAFQEQDAPFFCGRDLFVAKVVEAVHAQKKPLVAVIGSSGSGKSSVVFAGLVPHLRQEHQEKNHGNWTIAQFRPGDHPFQALAATLILILEPQMGEVDRLVTTKKLAEALRLGELQLQDVTQRIIQKTPWANRFLLIADQFEELYTLCQVAEERQGFLDMLLDVVARNEGNPRDIGKSSRSDIKASRTTAPNTSLVITMRADFLGYALSDRRFADALQHSDLKLGPMNDEELRAAVETPARQLNVDIEDGLIERILEAVSQEPGKLPLLEFALTLLWEKQHNRELTHDAYDEIGGVEKALARYAEEVYDKLTDEEQQRVQRVFSQLVRPGEGTEDTRRLANRSEVRENNWNLVARLADARLVVSGRDEATGEDTVEIAHEALIGGWKRLREWVEADRKFRTWQERLRGAVHLWEASGKDEGALLRGGPLLEAEHWLEERPSDLGEDEQEYIQASEALREAERRQRARLRRQVILGLAASLVVALVLAVLAAIKWLQAEHQFRQAQAQALAAQAIVPGLDPQLGILLAMEAVSTTLRVGEPALPQAVSALHLAVSRSQFRTALNGQDGQAHIDQVWSAAYSPDGKSIVTAGKDKTAKVWTWDDQNEKWEVLKTLGGQDGHRSSVNSAAYSPDGRLIVTAGSDDTAKVWDAYTGQMSQTLSGHSYDVNNAEFSPDARHIVTAGSDGTARIWDLDEASQTWKERSIPFQAVIITTTLTPKEEDRIWEGVLHAAFSPDADGPGPDPGGRFIVTANADHTAKVWDARTGRLLMNLVGHEDKVTSAEYSPDGKYIVTSGWDAKVRIWDAQVEPSNTPIERQALATLSGHTETVISARYSPDGKSIVTASDDLAVKIWDADSKKVLTTLQGHTEYVRCAQYSPDGLSIVTAGKDNAVKVWDAQIAQEPPMLRDHEGVVSYAAYSPDGKSIVTASNDNTAGLWDAQTGQISARLQGHTSTVGFVAYSPDGMSVVTTSEDRTAKIWDAHAILASPAKVAQASPTPRATLKHGNAVWNAAFSPDGFSVVTASKDGTAKVWNVQTGELLWLLKHANVVTDVVTSAEYSPDGSSIVTAGSDKTKGVWSAKVWKAKTGELLRTIPESAQEIGHAWFSPDGKSILNIRGDKVNIRDAQTGQMQRALSGHTGDVNWVTYSPDGRFIVTAGNDNTAKVWDAKTGEQPLHTLRGHTGSVLYAAYSPDPDGDGPNPGGQSIVTASKDGTAKVWDSQTGRELYTLPGHTQAVQFATYSPDGRYILTTSTDGTARQYIANLDHLKALAEERVTRSFTAEERATYLGEPLPIPTPDP